MKIFEYSLRVKKDLLLDVNIEFEIKNNMAYLNMHYTLVEDITR